MYYNIILLYIRGARLQTESTAAAEARVTAVVGGRGGSGDEKTSVGRRNLLIFFKSLHSRALHFRGRRLRWQSLIKYFHFSRRDTRVVYTTHTII